MPISAPRPSSSPSTNRVEALTTTAAASTSVTKRVAAARSRGHDRLGVARAEPGDVVDRGVRGRRPPRPTSFSPRNSVAKSSSVACPIARIESRVRRVADQLDPLQGGRHPRQEVAGDRPVDEQGLGRVADAGPLGLGVDHDGLGHVEVGRARRRRRGSCRAVEHVGDGGVLHAPSRPASGPPRGMRQSMNAVELHERDGRLTGGVLDEPDCVRSGSPAFSSPSRSASAITWLDASADDEPRSRTALPDLRQSPAASLVTFGPVLVDDPDHAEGDPDPLDPEPVGAHPSVDHLADRVGQAGHLPQPGSHRGDPGRVQAEPVERGGVGAGLPRHARGPRRSPRGSRRSAPRGGRPPGAGRPPERRRARPPGSCSPPWRDGRAPSRGMWGWSAPFQRSGRGIRSEAGPGRVARVERRSRHVRGRGPEKRRREVGVKGGHPVSIFGPYTSRDVYRCRHSGHNLPRRLLRSLREAAPRRSGESALKRPRRPEAPRVQPRTTMSSRWTTTGGRSSGSCSDR